MLTFDENVVRVEMNVQYRASPIRRNNICFSVTSRTIASCVRPPVSALRRRPVTHYGSHPDRRPYRYSARYPTRAGSRPSNRADYPADVNFRAARPPEEESRLDDAIAARENEQQHIREAEGIPTKFSRAPTVRRVFPGRGTPIKPRLSSKRRVKSPGLRRFCRNMCRAADYTRAVCILKRWKSADCLQSTG